MTRLLLNADIGERGSDHPTDRALLPLLDIANIACGGHAGDEASARAFAAQASAQGITVCAHLAYPDREGFGRRPMDITIDALCDALNHQRSLLPDARCVKLHGALYNQACIDTSLASRLARWCADVGFDHVLTLPDSALAKACAANGLTVIGELFAERRYEWSAEAGLHLMPRHLPGASITELEEALAQVEDMVRHCRVRAFTPGQGALAGASRSVPCTGQTICVHSDAVLALPLARAIRERIDGRRTPDLEAPP